MTERPRIRVQVGPPPTKPDIPAIDELASRILECCQDAHVAVASLALATALARMIRAGHGGDPDIVLKLSALALAQGVKYDFADGGQVTPAIPEVDA